MSWTKKQIIDQAFAEIGLASYTYDLQPEEYNKALFNLDAMMSTWFGKGINLGYPIAASPEDADITTETSLPAYANEAVYLNLAIRIAPGYGKQLSRDTKRAAKSALNVVYLNQTTPQEINIPNTTPAGAGGKRWTSDRDPFLFEGTTGGTASSESSSSSGTLESNFEIDGDLLQGSGLGTFRTMRNKVNGSGAPTVSNDTTEGYYYNSIWCDTTNTKAYICIDPTEGAAVWVDITAGAAGGEANTASNAGTGTSVFKGKVGVDLEFNAIKSENNLLTVALDSGTNDIELTVNEANFTAFVDKTSAETVNGVKTFGSFPITPTAAPTTDYQVANKKYVDDNAIGEANTASSVGTGTSIFKQKTGVGLEFNAIKSENTKLSVALDGVTNDVELTVNEGNIVHDNLSGFVANEHVDHSGVTLTAGTGLTGGGDITTNRTFNVDVGIADDKIVQIDDTDATDDDYAKFTANGLEGRSYSEVKTDLSLNNVENTALSTWAGSSNITTVGTVGSGTWQGTAIADAYIANDLTLAGATIGTSDITLKQSAGPTNTDEGTIEWDTDDDLLTIGDGTNTRKFSDIDTIIVAASDESTALTTGTAKVTFRMPNYATTLVAVRAGVGTAPTGSVLTVDINESGTTVLSTKITIDAGEKTSVTAATPPVISDSALAADAEITIDIDTVGSTVAGAGLKVQMDVRRV